MDRARQPGVRSRAGDDCVGDARLIARIARERALSFDVVASSLRRARESATSASVSTTVRQGGEFRRVVVTRRGYGPLTTKVGRALQYEFEVSDGWARAAVVVFGEVLHNGKIVTSRVPIPVRIDSGCLSGQLFGDLTCDCLQQLHLSLRVLGERGRGLLLHLPAQDGRGCGTAFKLAALSLQDELGLDTVEASELLMGGSRIDRRTYAGAIGVLQALGVTPAQPIELLTNNPRKIAALRENGYPVKAIPLWTSLHPAARRHLEAKRTTLGHTST